MKHNYDRNIDYLTERNTDKIESGLFSTSPQKKYSTGERRENYLSENKMNNYNFERKLSNNKMMSNTGRDTDNLDLNNNLSDRYENEKSNDFKLKIDEKKLKSNLNSDNNFPQVNETKGRLDSKKFEKFSSNPTNFKNKSSISITNLEKTSSIRKNDKF